MCGRQRVGQVTQVLRFGVVRYKAKIVSKSPWKAVYSGILYSISYFCQLMRGRYIQYRNGRVETASVALVAAWHAATGKVPILWTDAALGAGVDRSVYEK